MPGTHEHVFLGGKSISLQQYCCIAKKDNNADVEKYNLLLFFSFFLTEIYAWVEWERERVEDGFFGLSSSFFYGSKSSMVYTIFQKTWTILMVSPPAFALHVNMPPSSMPPMQFPQHYCWGTNCILLPLGNRCNCCYAISTT